MQAKDVMTTNVVSVTPDSTVSEIAQILLQRNISAVPVVDADGRLLGLVSEGDLIRRSELGTERKRSWWLDLLAGEGERAQEYVRAHGMHARDVMTGHVITVNETTDLAEIATILEEKRIKRVPVVRDGKIVGIVSRSNLLQGLIARGAPAPVATGDEDIRIRIVSELDELSWLHPTQLNVIVADGVVDVWGYVETAAQKDALRVAIENVGGIKEVKDHVNVLPHYLAGA